MENQAGIYYQGYGVQALPHQVANPLPPGTAPPQPAPPASAEVGVPPLPPQAAGPPPPPYGAAYQAPSYGYAPPSADLWSSYPVPPPAESYSYHSYPMNAFDRPGPAPGPGPGYGYVPYPQEPFPSHPPHSYPQPPGAFMPFPPRGSDVTSFRRKIPLASQQNLRPKGRAFKQPKQDQRFGGKPFKRGYTVPNLEPRVFNNAGFPGSVMAMHAQNMPPPFWQNRGDAGFAAHDSKRRRVNGDVRPPRKEERRIGYIRPRPDWRKGRKDRKPCEDVPEKSKDTKVERILLTEVEVQEIQRHARKRVDEFLIRLSEMKNSEITGSQDEVNSLAMRIDEPAQPDGVDAPQAVCRDGALTELMIAPQPACRDGASTDLIDAPQTGCADGASTDMIDGPQPVSTDVVDLNHTDEVRPNAVECLTFSAPVSMDMNAIQLDYSISVSADVHQSVKCSLEVPIGQDKGKDDEKSVPAGASITDKPRRLSEEEEREENTFEFFVKLLEENKGLRDVYIETCDNGVFECFMCNRLLKKRYSNLVSLVTHAINVLRTKKLPEHRGYGRAICALLDWDPFNLPKVPQNIIPRFGPESAVGNNVIATAGVVEPSQHVSHDKESAPMDEVAERSQHVGDHKESTPTDEVNDAIPFVDNDKEHPNRGEDEGHAPDGDVHGSLNELAEGSPEKQDLIESVAGKDGESCDKDGKLMNEGELESCMALEDAVEREGEFLAVLAGAEEVKKSEVEHIDGVEEMKGSEGEHIDAGNGVEKMNDREVEHIDGGNTKVIEAPVVDLVDI